MKIYTSIPTAVIILAVISAQPAWSAKLYKWVDKDGNISYQDSPPPEGSKLIKEEEISAPSPTDTDQPAQSSVVFRQQPVVVYTIPNCPACESVLEIFSNWNIPATEQSLQDRAVQARILEASDSLSAPTIYIGDNLISDQSEENLSTELQKAGYQINTEEDTEEETIDAES